MRAELYLILAAVFWGMNFHLAQFMMAESSFIEAATWRYIFGVATLILIGWRSLKRTKRVNVSVQGIVLVGFIGLFAFNLFFFKGLQHTNAINASLIVNLNPIMTILFAALILGLKITRNHIIGASISILGVAHLLFQGDLSNVQSFRLNPGDIYIFLGGIIFALHNIWVKIYKGALSNLNFTTLTNIACLIGFLLLTPFQPTLINIDHSPQFWLWSIGIGTFGTAFAYYSFNKGVSMIGPDRASMFLNLIPFTAVMFGIALGQPLYGYHVISGAVILIGVFIAQRTT